MHFSTKGLCQFLDKFYERHRVRVIMEALDSLNVNWKPLFDVKGIILC